MTNDLEQTIVSVVVMSRAQLYKHLDRVNLALQTTQDADVLRELRGRQALLTARLQVLGAEATWTKAVNDYREGVKHEH